VHLKEATNFSTSPWHYLVVGAPQAISVKKVLTPGRPTPLFANLFVQLEEAVNFNTSPWHYLVVGAPQANSVKKVLTPDRPTLPIANQQRQATPVSFVRFHFWYHASTGEASLPAILFLKLQLP
jgi:hypothetical protein